MGDTGKGLADFQQGERLPGAVFFDIDQVAAAASVPTADSDAAPDADAAAAAAPPLPHMLPSPEDFAAHMTALGVSNTRPVVVYNQPGCFSAARCWWTFKVFGHPAPVWVLNGGGCRQTYHVARGGKYKYVRPFHICLSFTIWCWQ